MSFHRKAHGALVSLLALAACACASTPSASAHEAPSGIAAEQDPYAPYAFLIGDWDTGASEGRPAAIVQHFRWGPDRSYLWYSVDNIHDGETHLHFEGIAIWNAANHNLDFLFTLEPGSGAQEQGTMRAEADGSIVRDVTMTGPDGRQSHFRQTFQRGDDDHASTALLSEQADGVWRPNFPGADNLTMSRRHP